MSHWLDDDRDRRDALHVKEQLAMAFYDDPVGRRIEARPFLKWVGGKTSVLGQLGEFFPPEIDRYIEPFLGGGAVFFHLKYRFPQMRAFLRDSNRELINCYRIVRDRPLELMVALDEHALAFRKGGAEYFYAVRKQHDLADDLARAARTIFLNKTCFNGLWRVNARGEFNTPVGSAKSPSLYDHDNLLACSLALRNAQLEAEDFRSVLHEARRGDFIYFDPPYLPISAYSDFKRYTADQFRETDQAELAGVFRELDARGCRVALSNSEHPRIRELYSGVAAQDGYKDPMPELDVRLRSFRKAQFLNESARSSNPSDASQRRLCNSWASLQRSTEGSRSGLGYKNAVQNYQSYRSRPKVLLSHSSRPLGIAGSQSNIAGGPQD